MNQELIIMVEQAAKVRGEPEIPREFILKALNKINSGEREVECYPFGAPSLKATYDVAKKLFAEQSVVKKS